MNKIKYNLTELSDVADLIIKNASARTLLFYGQMGAGKTTLIKELIKKLGVKDAGSSPTFSLVNEYEINDEEKVFHFDFYRIKNESEALDMGVEEYLYSNHWCLIEWPSEIENLLPLNSVKIDIQIIEDEQRELLIS